MSERYVPGEKFSGIYKAWSGLANSDHPPDFIGYLMGGGGGFLSGKLDHVTIIGDDFFINRAF